MPVGTRLSLALMVPTVLMAPIAPMVSGGAVASAVADVLDAASWGGA
ncbi:hypothetical protein JNUCC64_16430 [Streptomyces sp. JNUCC 64]